MHNFCTYGMQTFSQSLLLILVWHLLPIVNVFIVSRKYSEDMLGNTICQVFNVQPKLDKFEFPPSENPHPHSTPTPQIYSVHVFVKQ